MSLRKSPQLTPQLLAATRQNAQHSTGPRNAAAKQNSKLNALKHGAYVRDDNQRQAMLALGEDPEQFQTLTQELMSAFGPGDALWEKQINGLRLRAAGRGRAPGTLTFDGGGNRQCPGGNVLENKGSAFQTPQRSGNVIENTRS